MIAVRQDITIATNAAFDLAARWEAEDGTPFELSDAALQIRPVDGGEPVVDANVTNGLITLAEPDWWAAVLLEQADTAAIETFGAFRYDLVVVRAIDDREEQLLYGWALIRPGVSVLA